MEKLPAGSFLLKRLPLDYTTVLVFDALTELRPNEAAASCKLLPDNQVESKT